MFIRAAANKPLSNISLKNITVNTAPYNGIYFSGAHGTISYCNLIFNNVLRDMNGIPSNLSWTQADDCQTPTPSEQGLTTADQEGQVRKFFREGKLFISVNGNIYDSFGRLIY